jgi:hypothetical protein
VGDDPAGRFTGIVPALESSDDYGCIELADAVELDRTPPPSALRAAWLADDAGSSLRRSS